MAEITITGVRLVDYRKIIKKNLSKGRSSIPEIEAYKICDAFDIPYPCTEVVREKSESFKVAENVGYPVVIKVLSPDIVHKSDVGGVITGIENKEQLSKAYDDLEANIKERAPFAKIEGIVIQKAMPKGVEVVIGGLRNEQFGPVVMFGAGGVLVEVFKDVSFRLAPLDPREALKQIAETKIYKVLQGFRGDEPCDLEAVSKLIVNTGRLICEIPEIKELDFNPVIVYPDGCVAVDARIILVR